VGELLVEALLHRAQIVLGRQLPLLLLVALLVLVLVLVLLHLVLVLILVLLLDHGDEEVERFTRHVCLFLWSWRWRWAVPRMDAASDA